MKAVLIFLILSVVSAAHSAVLHSDILDWKPTDGITEAQAVKQADQAIGAYLNWDSDNLDCTVDEIWGYEYQSARPDDGRSAFAILATASAPDQSCKGLIDYDCRALFAKDANGAWSVESTSCASAGSERF